MIKIVIMTKVDKLWYLFDLSKLKNKNIIYDNKKGEKSIESK